MRRPLLILLSLVFAAGTAMAQQPEPPPRQQPEKVQGGDAIKNRATAPVVQSIGASGSIFVKENQWDFGHVAQDAKVTHRFLVQNVGDDTLFIQKIKPT